MMKFILPLGLALVGVGGGIGAGLALKPEPEQPADTTPCGAPDKVTADKFDPEAGHGADTPKPETSEYVKLNNQFVVPIVGNDRVESLVVLSLSIEIAQGRSDLIYEREPKLRDAFLQVLFDHANMGGFAGAFTRSRNMEVLRSALAEVAHDILGPDVRGVLVTDIGRQDS